MADKQQLQICFLFTLGRGFNTKSAFPSQTTPQRTRLLTAPEAVHTFPRLPQMRSPDVPKTGFSVPGKPATRVTGRAS